MPQFVMLMIDSAPGADWESYVSGLIAKGNFNGGSSLGNGVTVTRQGSREHHSVKGYIRISAKDITEARALVEGNPVYESGGAIELLEEIED